MCWISWHKFNTSPFGVPTIFSSICCCDFRKMKNICSPARRTLDSFIYPDKWIFIKWYQNGWLKGVSKGAVSLFYIFHISFRGSNRVDRIWNWSISILTKGNWLRKKMFQCPIFQLAKTKGWKSSKKMQPSDKVFKVKYRAFLFREEILLKTNTSAATGRVNCPTWKLIWEPTNPGVLGAELVVSGSEEIERVYFPTQNPSLTSNMTPPSSELDIAATTVFKAVPERLRAATVHILLNCIHHLVKG